VGPGILHLDFCTQLRSETSTIPILHEAQEQKLLSLFRKEATDVQDISLHLALRQVAHRLTLTARQVRDILETFSSLERRLEIFVSLLPRCVDAPGKVVCDVRTGLLADCVPGTRVTHIGGGPGIGKDMKKYSAMPGTTASLRTALQQTSGDRNTGVGSAKIGYNTSAASFKQYLFPCGVREEIRERMGPPMVFDLLSMHYPPLNRWEFDLTVRDERIVVVCILDVASDEGVECLQDASWSLAPTAAGKKWKVPQSWLEEGGLPREGRFSFSYVVESPSKNRIYKAIEHLAWPVELKRRGAMVA